MFNHFTLSREDREHIHHIYQTLRQRYQGKRDPWGFDIKNYLQFIELFYPFYKNYFKVRVFGVEHLKTTRPFLVAANKSGPLPIDQILLSMAFCLAPESPLILRSHVEPSWAKVPFLSPILNKLGPVVSHQKNYSKIFSQGESLLCFPEKKESIGSGFYQLQSLDVSFFKTALVNNVEILPVCVIGAEEMYPFSFQIRKVANLFNLPKLPFSAISSVVGPLGLIPLPSPVDIYIGHPFSLNNVLPQDAPDRMIAEQLFKVQEQMKKLIHRGLVKRRPFLDAIRLPISEVIRSKMKSEDGK